MHVKIIANDTGRPVGKLADAELHCEDGPFAGLKLIGFMVWETGDASRTVTFPSRQYSVNGERRSYALLRPIADVKSVDSIKELILTAYESARPCLSSGGKVLSA